MSWPEEVIRMSMKRRNARTPDPRGRAAPHRGAKIFCCTATVTVLLVLGACSGGITEHATSTTAPETAAPTISWTHFDVPEPPAMTADLAAQGKRVFDDNCSSCHGKSGAADGLCAKFLIPQPRDFTTGVYRFKSTPGSEMPTDRDLYRTVSLGIHSTGMPPWRFLLSEEDRWALIAYIKTFSDRFESRGPGTPVDLGTEPQTITDDMVDRGREMFVRAQCGKCHGEEGYGDGPAALTLVDSFGNAIPPRNYHKAADFKRGHTLRDIALTVHTGNNGTPMPAFDEALSEAEIWDLAAYIMSLAEKRFAGGGTPASAVQGEHLGKPDVVIQLTERQWKFIPDEIRVRQGQLVRIDFQPTDNGLGVGHGFAIDGYDKSAFINGAMVQRPKSVTFRADKSGSFVFYCATQCSTGPLHPKMNGRLIVEPAKS
ncbi:MAG: c-type cytochrome [Thermoanaerobaculia bacterium]